MLQLGQVLTGRVGSYRLTRQLYDSVWLAVKEINHPSDQQVIIKHADHFRLANERDVLRRFQAQTQHLRPLIDEIQLDSQWPALVLKWLHDDVLNTSTQRKLGQCELKRVARGVLKALDVLHSNGFVHTDIKPSNILVNYKSPNGEIEDVQLADLESCVREDSKYAKDGAPIGTPIFRSTEAFLELPWGTPTDVWSFGVTMISLIYGGNFHLFKPDVPADHEDYVIKILLKQNEFFGPYPLSYQELANQDHLEVLAWIMENTSAYKPFRRIAKSEVSEEDKTFLLKIMKFDPRDRPTVQALLADEWFMSTEVAELDQERR